MALVLIMCPCIFSRQKRTKIKMNAKYYLSAALTIPLLPILYFQGKRVKSGMPKLPPAEGETGCTSECTSANFQLITIGESTIAGVGVATHEEGFTGTLARELSTHLGGSVNWRVYAKSGYTAKKVRERILPNIEENQVDLIVIGLGANDAFELNSPRKWQKELRLLIQNLQQRFPGTPIAFTNMPPIKEFPGFTPLMKITLGNLVEMLGEVLEQTILPYDHVFYFNRKITFAEWIKRLDMKSGTTEFFSDGVHPSKLTYQLWAQDFAAFLLDKREAVFTTD